MPDLLNVGAQWLSGQLKAAAGSVVTYRRGDMEAEVTASIGRSEFESTSSSGAIENWESRDFLILAEDLPFGEPERGDLVLELAGGDELEYEVAAPRGIPVFRFGDAFRSIVRVHTKQSEGVAILATEAGEQLTTEAGQPLVAT